MKIKFEFRPYSKLFYKMDINSSLTFLADPGFQLEQTVIK